MSSISPSRPLKTRPERLSSPVCHNVVSRCVCVLGECGLAGEQLSTVTAVFIGTQVSSGVLGCLDNTFDPLSPL